MAWTDILAVPASQGTSGGFMTFTEDTAPTAPASNNVTIYAVDNGAGRLS